MAEQKVYCASAASDVYRAISTVHGRERFWAEQAPETDGVISFVLADGRTDESRIERAVQDQLYVLRYFGRTLTFRLAPATDFFTAGCRRPRGFSGPAAAGHGLHGSSRISRIFSSATESSDRSNRLWLF